MSRQHTKMADLYTLADKSIETIRNIVNGQSETPPQLNRAQCKILAHELEQLSANLKGKYDKFKAGQDARQIALLHLHSVIIKAKLLVEKCCCKNVESWPLEAMTLVEIQEDFAAIILDLHQWRITMDVAIAVVNGASRGNIMELLLSMDEEYQVSYRKLRRSNHALQQAAVEDRKETVLKLAEVQESEDSLGHLCALHLQAWLAQVENGTHFTNSDVIQMLITHIKIEKLLGKGSYGAVQRVKWLGAQCALKTLNENDEREATVLKGLLHPNIVRLFLYWDDLPEIETLKEADGTDAHEIGPPLPKSNLLMELMDTDLSKHIESRLKRIASSSAGQSGEGEDMMPFSLPVAIDIMLQVGQALRYMHDKHLTHRDLKTANILVRRVNKALTSLYGEGYLEIKLADFGLAKAYENSSTSQRQTVNRGTKVYGAPEVFEKDWATDRNFPPMADVWSFGMTCSEILSGKAPYENENVRTLHTRIVKQNLRPSLPKGCPEYLAFIIRGCWELKPERRPNFASICRMLRHAKLVSLGITKLDDSRSFLGYSTRRGPVRAVENRRSWTERFVYFLRSPFRNVRIPSIGEVQTFALEDGSVQSETAEEKQQPRDELVDNEQPELHEDLSMRSVDPVPDRRPAMSVGPRPLPEDVRPAFSMDGTYSGMESDRWPSERTSSNEFGNYDVYLCHRGPDTQKGFVSYLYRDLNAAGLQPFLDCRSIVMGDDEWESIEHAIKRTPIAVVVFSESFAASPWCLKELDAILSTPGIKVLPIFYNVRPSEVGSPESGQLRDGFEKLSRRHDKLVIERWRSRLDEASKLMGWEHAGVHKRLEAELVSDVVGTILALANKPLPLLVGDDVVGVKQVAEEIIQILEMKKEVLMLGLWGMGGIGKSTLARELYNQMSKRYDSACYIEDVTEKVMEGGVVKVQERIMKDLCKNNAEIEGKSKGKRILEERLCKKRFLLVLDDVRDEHEMVYYISRDMLAAGSMCIVTSRDRRVFKTSDSFEVEHEVYIHDVQGLSIPDSERLFTTYAFGGCGRMEPGFEELVSSISKGCGGVPLVLKVCGLLLKHRDNVEVRRWREVLAKLNDGTIMEEKKIFECLWISYDGLQDTQQEMFLDVACALIGERKDLAVRVWKSLNWTAELGIRSLIEKALITVDENGYLQMHVHLMNMGREIVRMYRARDGIIRRLWMPESLKLLGKNLGENKQLPDSLQTLNLSIKFGDRYKVKDHMIDLDVSHMVDLRILMCNGPLKILSRLPTSMRWFQYKNEGDVQAKFSFTPQNSELVILEFTSCKFYIAPKLFGELSNLEVLHLHGCKNLTMLPDSFGGLIKMQELWLHDLGIKSLPKSFGEMCNLEVLSISGCKNLTMLPDSFGNLKKLKDVRFYDSGIDSLPKSL